MGWEDRPYYRDRNPSTNRLGWLMNGSVPLFTAFGIRVRAHASLVVVAVLMLIFGTDRFNSWHDRVLADSILFAIILMHEFGHCFAARYVGGSADEIVMTPLGGLAMADCPRRPLPTFITVAAGPAVNVLICALCWGFDHTISNWWYDGASVTWQYAWLINAYFLYLSWILLLFNVLPVYPLDGGRILQTALWPKLGYYRSTMITCLIGTVGGGLMGIYGLMGRNPWMMMIGISCVSVCLQTRLQMRAAGPEEFADETDYSAAYERPTAGRKKSARQLRAAKRARKIATAHQAEAAQLDVILAKVSAGGMGSLTWSERRQLKKATAQRRRQEELI